MKQTQVMVLVTVVVAAAVCAGYFVYRSSETPQRAADAPAAQEQGADDVVGDAGGAVDAERERPRIAGEAQTQARHYDALDTAAYEEALAKAKGLDQKFEVVLNGVLKDIAQRAATYKKERQVMIDLTSPENIRDPQYVEENFALMQEIVPKLEEQTVAILSVFEKADAEVQKILSGESADMRKELGQEWAKIKAENVDAYIGFFLLESDLIRAHERLMRFYYVKRNHYTVDAQTGNVEFASAGDQALAHNLRVQITRLENAQKNAQLYVRSGGDAQREDAPRDIPTPPPARADVPADMPADMPPSEVAPPPAVSEPEDVSAPDNTPVTTP